MILIDELCLIPKLMLSPLLQAATEPATVSTGADQSMLTVQLWRAISGSNVGFSGLLRWHLSVGQPHGEVVEAAASPSLVSSSPSR